ncbi:molybdate ABC transporter substrate-binding protein [Haloechinothrix sp. YIM 98757]|uniref:Molybdate ABC transporter substrate-binding protein n=1 Tax=Haloechinothrix aidingensis TaxID=2752311 RepID=A0A838AEN2_9PSEU|nr:molybdate ABC transporter substrate-binding protein [Haloechinothrix aidingensis]MBA0127703.1 molybdate ABC transporter substrate-binding protein [Haloechinothrix aidingensis]
MRRAFRPLLALALSAVSVCAACAPGGDREVLTVFAASSLTEVLGEVEDSFTAEHPDVEVRVNLAGSSRLAHQLGEGAPADVFVSADPETMRTVAEQDMLADDPAVLATNTLTIATAPGNPHRIAGLDDLADPELHAVTCAAQVPCGRATRRLVRAHDMRLRPASEELSVKAVLQKVLTGDADAGIVYRSDVRAAGESVESIDIAGAESVVNEYRIAVLADAAHPRLAREFVRYLRDEPGRRALTAAGFGVDDDRNG